MIPATKASKNQLRSHMRIWPIALFLLSSESFSPNTINAIKGDSTYAGMAYNSRQRWPHWAFTIALALRVYLSCSNAHLELKLKLKLDPGDQSGRRPASAACAISDWDSGIGLGAQCHSDYRGGSLPKGK